MPNGNANLRRRLHVANPKCHWCPTVTLLEPFHKVPRDTWHAVATVDHILCKLEAPDRQEYNAAKNKVLACHGCNKRRNDEFIQRHRPDGVHPITYPKPLRRAQNQSPRPAKAKKPPTMDDVERFNTRVRKRVWQLAAEGDNRENLYEIVSRELMGFEALNKRPVGHTFY